MIIGLCGLAGSGKSFVAARLEKQYELPIINFADPLKRICKDVFNFTDDQLWGPSQSRNEPDKRYPRKCKECSGNGHFENFCDDEAPVPCDFCDGTGGSYLTPREALQQLGTEWGRNCYESVWIDYAIRIAQELMSTTTGYNSKLGICPRYAPSWVTYQTPYRAVIIGDVRFRNEMEGVQKAGGKVVKVVRNTTSLTGASAQHISETEQAQIPDQDFDYVLQNVDDLEVLDRSLNEMMRSFDLGL